VKSIAGVKSDVIAAGIQPALTSISAAASKWMNSQAAAISQTLANLQSLVVDPSKLTVLQATLDQCSTVIDAAGQAVDQNIRQPLLKAYDSAAANGSTAMQLVRAFGDPPQVPHLDLRPAAVAYLYDWANGKIPITPVLARANQVGQALNALGVTLPAVGLGQALIPPDLSKFDLNKILPNFAGLNLKDLFAGVKMPGLSAQHVTVTHGWEPQTRRAWLQADVKVPIPQRLVVFQAGALAFCITDSTLEATCKIQNDGTNVQQRTNGSIRGTWSVEIGVESEAS
jgi:hypothetical protein